MSSVLTLADLERMREVLNGNNTPPQGRVVMMHKKAFTEWCSMFELTMCQVKHEELDNGVIQVYL